MKRKDMSPEQIDARKARRKRRYEEHREEVRARRRKYYSSHREERKKYYAEHREERKKYYEEHREEKNARLKQYKAEDLNRNGLKKCTIRTLSRHILERVHAKLDGYEIHHCFGYEDPAKFIYIPRKLHLEIHEFLRSKNISADSDHWMAIRDLVNNCEEYTYIKC